MAKGRKSSIRKALLVGLGAFFIAVPVGFLSQGVVANVRSLVIKLSVLLGIVVVGILLDVVGTAVTAAHEPVFHAMAARRIPWARKGVWLVRHADSVANFCNDVVGDVASAVSGALGAGLALRLASGEVTRLRWEILVTASIAAVTVGGKALGKGLALRRSDEIIGLVARLLTGPGGKGLSKDRKQG